jgi:hypothetical protein
MFDSQEFRPLWFWILLFENCHPDWPTLLALHRRHGATKRHPDVMNYQPPWVLAMTSGSI